MEQGVVLVGEPARARRTSFVGLVTAIVGFAVCAAVAVLSVAPRFVPERYLASFSLADDWQLIAMAAGLVGAVLALVGLVAALVAISTGQRGGRTTWALVLAVAGLALAGFSWWFVSQPPYLRYGLKQLPAARQASLDALDPQGVVTAFLTARDLSVDYWVSDEQLRRNWHTASWDPAGSPHFPPWGVLAGADGLRVTPHMDADHPATDAQRSFRATYTAGSGSREEYIVVVSRTSDGPWRVQDVQFPL